MTQMPVLIVGAGPTGLLLALRLARHGIACRIIDKNAGPGLASRAMVVQARTLELYDQLGLADKIIGQGIIVDEIHVRKEGREAAQLNFRNFGGSLSPYPFVLSFPQDDHERLLVGELSAAGVKVEWNTALQGLRQDDALATATLDQGGKSQIAQFQYVCGCDGARSKTRELLNLNFDGGTYKNIFYVADVKLTKNPDVQAQASLSNSGFALQFPIRSSGMNRLIGIVSPFAESLEHITFSDLQGLPEKLLNVEVVNVNWFSTYHVHHRVAAHFKVGRVFLLGDAGHIHSPAGGQGLNTGLGDAVNLSWKLAQVLQNRAAPELLESYEPERLAFAKKLVATTDQAFSVLVSGSWQARLIRNVFVPYVLPRLLKFNAIRRLVFKTISQIAINYRESPLGTGNSGAIHAGDRLPYVASLNNFSTLNTLDWQLHTYGETISGLRDYCSEIGLKFVNFPTRDETVGATLSHLALYLIRPDGYVGLALLRQDVAALKEYIAKHQLVFA